MGKMIGKEPKPKKIKVLYIDKSISFGGAIKSLSLVLSCLPNIEPIVISYQDKDIIDKWLRGIKVYRLKHLLDYRLQERLSTWVKTNISTKLLKRLILKTFASLYMMESSLHMLLMILIARYHKIHLIHLNTGFIEEGLLAARILKIPCLVHLRGMFTEKRKRGILKLMKHTTHVISVSNAVAKGVCDAGIPPNKITTIYDPVDLAAFDKYRLHRSDFRTRIGLNDADIAVGIFGRVIPWKGQLEFVYSALHAIKENPNIKVVIVCDESDGRPDYFNKIKEIINSSGYRENFILTGYQEDVEGFYIAMDIVVHASIEPEPFGMVVPEGMAARKSVIATNAGGPTEIVSHGIDGLLVPPGDIDKMTAAILELANDPIKRKTMGANGYNKVKTQFAIPNIASQVEKAYQEILCKPKV